MSISLDVTREFSVNLRGRSELHLNSAQQNKVSDWFCDTLESQRSRDQTRDLWNRVSPEALDRCFWGEAIQAIESAGTGDKSEKILHVGFGGYGKQGEFSSLYGRVCEMDWQGGPQANYDYFFRLAVAQVVETIKVFKEVSSPVFFRVEDFSFFEILNEIGAWRGALAEILNYSNAFEFGRWRASGLHRFRLPFLVTSFSKGSQYDLYFKRMEEEGNFSKTVQLASDGSLIPVISVFKGEEFLSELPSDNRDVLDEDLPKTYLLASGELECQRSENGVVMRTQITQAHNALIKPILFFLEKRIRSLLNQQGMDEETVLKELLSIYYWMVHAASFDRGSAACSEICILALSIVLGCPLKRLSGLVNHEMVFGDLEAIMASSEQEFVDNYSRALEALSGSTDPETIKPLA